MSESYTAAPGETFPQVTEDGGWCWFADPRAIIHNGALYVGWVDSSGSIWIGKHLLGSEQVDRHRLHEALENDDHNNPTIRFLPDDRIQVFYSRHSRDDMYVIESVEPEDISAWQDRREIRLNSVETNADVYGGGNDTYTYPSPIQLSEEGNRLYLIWRGLDFKPNYAVSDDQGQTWSPGRIFVYPEATYKNQRPYTKYASEGIDRFHMAFTDGHPRNESTNGIHYACYRAGAFFRADGSRIADLGAAPFGPRDADIVYDARTTGVKSWVWEVAADPQGHPVIVYARFPTDTDHRYHYARWDGTKWHDHEIVSAGGWFPQTRPDTEEREPNYSPGIALNRSNPSIVYLSRQVRGVREIERWETDDLGATWSTDAVTADSERDNIRPWVADGPDGAVLMWLNVDYYRHFTDYQSSIRYVSASP